MRRFPKITKAWAWLLLVCIVVAIVTGICVKRYPPINGVLLDADNGKPIPGAAIAGVYGVSYPSPGGLVDKLIDSRETKTDSDGKFTLPLVYIIALPFSFAHDRPRILAFAPGYESVDLWPGRQAFSHKKIPVGKGLYQEESRPIMSVNTKNGNQVYVFRASRLETDVERQDDWFWHDFAPVSKEFIPKLNAERRKYGYGMPVWQTAKINGLVLDAKDGKPIKYARVAGIFGFQRLIASAEPRGWIGGLETITLEDGKFCLGAMHFLSPPPFCRMDDRPRICIFAPGYEAFDFPEDYNPVDPRGSGKDLKKKPAVTVSTKNGTQVYVFRLSPLDTDAAKKKDLRNAFSDVPDRWRPQMLRAINEELQKYDMN